MIYVMSDIHGNKKNFDSIMEQISLQPDDTLYILGDVVDRHSHGIELLQIIKEMPNVKMLLGNHEYMMLNVVGRPYNRDNGLENWYYMRKLDLWYSNGGSITHQEFEKLNEVDRTDLLCYLNGLPVSADVELNGTKFKLVHAAPPEMFVPKVTHYKDERQYAVWCRLKPEDDIPEGYTLIFGHTPTVHFQDDDILRIWYGKNRIGIDCGSGFPVMRKTLNIGRLACLRLDDMTEFYSEAENNDEVS